MNVHTRPSPAPISDHAHDDQIRVPREVVFLIIGFVSLALALTIAARLTGIGVSREEPVAALQQISFTATGMGQVADDVQPALIVSPRNGAPITLAPEGEEAFPRLILRGIVELRRRAHIDPDLPIMLEIAPDGQRMLRDPETGRIIRLAAFGPENGLSFDPLLPPDRQGKVR